MAIVSFTPLLTAMVAMAKRCGLKWPALWMRAQRVKPATKKKCGGKPRSSGRVREEVTLPSLRTAI